MKGCERNSFRNLLVGEIFTTDGSQWYRKTAPSMMVELGLEKAAQVNSEVWAKPGEREKVLEEGIALAQSVMNQLQGLIDRMKSIQGQGLADA